MIEKKRKKYQFLVMKNFKTLVKSYISVVVLEFQFLPTNRDFFKFLYFDLKFQIDKNKTKLDLIRIVSTERVKQKYTVKYKILQLLFSVKHWSFTLSLEDNNSCKMYTKMYQIFTECWPSKLKFRLGVLYLCELIKFINGVQKRILEL